MKRRFKRYKTTIRKVSSKRRFGDTIQILKEKSKFTFLAVSKFAFALKEKTEDKKYTPIYDIE
jgi:hypothetical protein